MANYTAQDVKKLRDLTGAGMLDCKNALADNDGDFDKAVEQLRIKGAKDVGKRAGRATAEGLIAAKAGVLIELNSETDFVAKNADFQDLAEKIVAAAVSAGAKTLEELNAVPLDEGTVDDAVQNLAAKIGEKIQLRRIVAFEGPVALYLHKRSADLPPAVGVIVEYKGEGDQAAEAAKGAAMQIAAMKAKYLSRDDVPEDLVETERRIAEQTAREEGKPDQALPKIIEGRVNGFFKDVVLLDQPSVTDSKKNVGAILHDAGVTVTGFARLEVGQD